MLEAFWLQMHLSSSSISPFLLPFPGPQESTLTSAGSDHSSPTLTSYMGTAGLGLGREAWAGEKVGVRGTEKRVISPQK